MTAQLMDTLIELLQERAASNPEAGYLFLEDGEREGPSLTLPALDLRARALGAALASRGAAGKRVLLLYTQGLDFVEALFGAMYAGAIPVPAYPPDPSRLTRTLPRLLAVIRDAGVDLALTTSGLRDLAVGMTDVAPELAGVEWLASDALPTAAAADWRRPAVKGRDLAILQYTSGSTGVPRGVALSHRNLLHQVDAFWERAGRRKRIVNWAPFYHDLGLVGGIVGTVAGAHQAWLMSPLDFLARPIRWLNAITRHRAQATSAPNFACDLCTRRISDADWAQVDLSSLEVLAVSAEPVSAATLEAFTRRFAPRGLRPTALAPAYGLAEATLAVTLEAQRRPFRVVHVDPAAIESGRVVLQPADSGARALVGCGEPLSEMSVHIVHTDRRTPSAVDEVGEIWVRGPSLAEGYWERPEDSAEVFEARMANGDGPFLRTGDLGFLFEGELFVTGRMKDLIIVRGRNLYPQDVERTAEEAHPAIRRGCVAAFALTGGETERLGLVVEVNPERLGSSASDVIDAIRTAVIAEHEVAPYRIALVAPRTVPKTSSGKIQRRASREALLSGELEVLADSAVDDAVVEPPACLYPGLAENAPRLDARQTKYQFALEDVEWHRLDEPGEYVPPALAEVLGVDVAAIKNVPGAWETFQWGMGLSLCDSFIELEEAVIRFLRAESRALGEHRSLELLGEEEEKHILVFRRYAEHLRAARPDLLPAYDRHFNGSIRRGFHLEERPDHESDAAYHYAVWVGILFFEEYTVWLHSKLSDEGARVQPAWLSAHGAHAREERQHVATDHAWITALGLSDAQREAWSRQLTGRAIHPFIAPMAAQLALLADKFPELRGVSLSRLSHDVVLSAVLEDRAFRRTREVAPAFGRHASRSTAPRPAVLSKAAARRATREELSDWIRSWFSQRRGGDRRGFRASATFAELGLDSAEALSLAGDLEAWLGCRLAPTLAYDYATPVAVAEELARALGAIEQSASSAAPSFTAADASPVSSRQLRLWHLDRKFPGEIPDHLTTVYALHGPLDVGALTDALRQLSERHPALRTTFRESQGRVEQIIGPAAESGARVLVAGEGAWSEIARARAAEIDVAPYDLAQGPLLRVELIRDSRHRHALAIGMHHIVTDAWSVGVLMADLQALYEANAREIPSSLSPVGTDPLTVARDEAALVTSNEGMRRRDWWRERLADHPSAKRPARSQLYRGGIQRRSLSPASVERLKSWAEQHEASLFLALLASVNTTLRQRTGHEDVLVCTHVLDRPSAAHRALVGYLVNVLALRTDLSGTRGLDAVLRRVRASWLDGIANELPIDHLVRELWPDRYAERWMPSPFAFNMLPWDAAPRGELIQMERLVEALPTPSFLFFDQMLLAQPEGDGLAFTLWYDQDAIAETEAAGLLDGLLRVLEKEIE